MKSAGSILIADLHISEITAIFAQYAVVSADSESSF
jgi:hypothetical protein